ncbi:MAG: polysaccharide biosynthesis C-terminal domain-containing protein [Gammaproteobacteria bacterium]
MNSLDTLHHTRHVLINRLAVPIGGLVLLIIIGRHSDRLLGQYALVMTFYYVMQMLPLLGLTSFVMREVARAPHEAGTYFVTIGAMSMLGCAAVDALSFAFVHFANYEAEVRRAIGLVGVVIYPGILAFIAEIIFMSVERARPVARIAVAENVLRVLASTWALLAGHGVFELVLVLFATRLIALVAYVIEMKRLHLVANFGWPSRALFARSIEVLPVFLWGTLVFTILSRLDFLVLSFMEPVETLGYYAIGYRLFEVFVIVLTGLVMAMFPRVSRKFMGARSQFLITLRNLVVALTGGLAFVAAAVTLFADYYVLILFRDQYPHPVALSQLFAAALMFAGMDFVASGILHASDQQAPDIRALTVGGILLSLLLLSLVPHWGIYGAFAAKTLATIVQCGLKFAAISNHVGRLFTAGEIARLTALVALTAVPVLASLSAPLGIRVAVTVALVPLITLSLAAGGFVQPLRLLRFYRRPRPVSDVASFADLLDMLAADERRRVAVTRVGKHPGARTGGWRDRSAVPLYRLARFLFLRRRARAASLVATINARLNRCAIASTVRVGPGLVVEGPGTIRVDSDLGENITLRGEQRTGGNT